MNSLIHIGFGNIVNAGKIIAVVSPDSAPVKRMVQKARELGTAIDATQGRKTKSVLVMENSQLGFIRAAAGNHCTESAGRKQR